METVDPATGAVLPSDAIQRILFIANAVHVYNIPPLASTKGHTAASWTTDPSRHIFTARLRVIETSYESESESDSSGRLKVDAVLEDPSTGQLFAAAPYADPAVVEPALDSSRFFAVTVRDPSGRRAMLGVGFEERAEAFDLGVALQEAARGLGWEKGGGGDQKKASSSAQWNEEQKAKDYSLKEGETITVNLGSSSKFGKRLSQQQAPPSSSDAASSSNLQSFALAPPPSGADASSSGGGGGSGGGGAEAGFSLPPPPSAQEVKRNKRLSAKDLGFDDGQFGEFA